MYMNWLNVQCMCQCMFIYIDICNVIIDSERDSDLKCVEYLTWAHARWTHLHHWHRWQKLLGQAGHGLPTFWPLWATPISGSPTFDSQGLRKSVKDTHNDSFTSWIPASPGIQYEKHPTRWLLWHSDITKFNFGQGPGPRWRSLRRSPKSPSWLARGILSPHSPLPYRPLASRLKRDWPTHFSDASAALWSLVQCPVFVHWALTLFASPMPNYYVKTWCRAQNMQI